MTGEGWKVSTKTGQAHANTLGRARGVVARATYEPVLGRNELIGHRLEAMAEKLCGGSLTPLLTNLVRSKRLTARERREIRKLMEELDS